LPSFVERLRAEGFPADALDAIVTAQVHAAFAARRQALARPPDEKPYWQTPAADREPSPEERGLDREETKLVRSLVGDDAFDAAFDDGIAAVRRQLPNLSREKILALSRLADEATDREADLQSPAAQLAGSGTLPGTAEKTAALQREFRAKLVALLTPAELEEVDLRTGDTADTLRENLAAFNASESEFRAIFKLQQAFDLHEGLQSTQLSPEAEQAYDEAKKKLEASIHAALGDARYADYQRAADPRFQLTSQLVTRLGQPAETTRQLWELQNDFEPRIAALREDYALPPDERTRRITALADEARTKLTATLGPRGFDAYAHKSIGAWFRGLQSGAAAGSPKK